MESRALHPGRWKSSHSAAPAISISCQQCTARTRRIATARGRRIRHGVLDVMPIGLVGRSGPRFARFGPASRRSRRCFPTRCFATSPSASHSRKLVVFSDSRQDAAKLSAGMRFSHYRDALRQAITQAIAVQGAGAQAFASQVAGQALPPQQQALAAAFANTNPAEAATLSMAANATTAHLRSPSHPGLSCQQAAQQILVRAAQGPFHIAQLAADASSQLLTIGINPGGFSQDVLWTDPRRKREAGGISTFGGARDDSRSPRA